MADQEINSQVLGYKLDVLDLAISGLERKLPASFVLEELKAASANIRKLVPVDLATVVAAAPVRNIGNQQGAHLAEVIARQTAPPSAGDNA